MVVVVVVELEEAEVIVGLVDLVVVVVLGEADDDDVEMSLKLFVRRIHLINSVVSAQVLSFLHQGS